MLDLHGLLGLLLPFGLLGLFKYLVYGLLGLQGRLPSFIIFSWFTKFSWFTWESPILRFHIRSDFKVFLPLSICVLDLLSLLGLQGLLVFLRLSYFHGLLSSLGSLKAWSVIRFDIKFSYKASHLLFLCFLCLLTLLGLQCLLDFLVLFWFHPLFISKPFIPYPFGFIVYKVYCTSLVSLNFVHFAFSFLVCLLVNLVY